jgi:hypothetical protein
MDDMKNGEVREFRHLRIRDGEPVAVPDGWFIPEQRLDSHHQRYSILIQKETTNASDG